MAKKIVILEDNAERRAAMLHCLEDKFYQFEKRFFDGPAEMIDFLKVQFPETIAISLDHDFELIPGPDGRLHDPGTGREAADFLAQHTPCCPVVIHSTNDAAASGMDMVLQDAHWETHRVCPCGDLEWISGPWLRTMRNAIVASVKATSTRG